MTIKRYDLCLNMQKSNNQVNLFHQVFTQWYNKVREADKKVVIYLGQMMTKEKTRQTVSKTQQTSHQISLC